MMKTYRQQIISFICIFTFLFCTLTPKYADAKVKVNVIHPKGYDAYYLSIDYYELDIYTNIPDKRLDLTLLYIKTKYTTTERYFKAVNDIVWTSSNPEVVQFITGKQYDASGNANYTLTDKLTSEVYKNRLLDPEIIGLAPGESILTAKSKLLGETLTCKVTVHDSQLKCNDTVFYNNNTYTFTLHGNATATGFASSNPDVATIDAQTGVMTTLKTGKTTISCTGSDGLTYTYKVKVEKCGLSYTKLTSYYIPGSDKMFNGFPLVAKGLEVKKWKSSNKKVCTPVKYKNVALLQMRGPGKCTITCITKSGKKYKCKLTVQDGTLMSYEKEVHSPKLSEIKKHGYYKDINSIMDYGRVVVMLEEFNHKINLKNGNKRFKESTRRIPLEILKTRFPEEKAESLPGLGCFNGTYVTFLSNDGKKMGKIRVLCGFME